MIEQAPVRVSISVLGTDFTELGRTLERIRLSGADSIHLDLSLIHHLTLPTNREV